MIISKEIFFDTRMLKIFLLGCISGFPWVLIGSCLSLWLKEDGLSRSVIGWAGLIFSVYAINYLWAPIIDRVKIPFLTKKIGHRKSWILLMQLVILLCLCIWSVLQPSADLYLIVFIGLVIAISSSTQDITIDALRIEQMEKHETKSIAAAASIAVIGWWTGYKLGGFFALYIAEYFENLGNKNYWQLTFLIITIVIIICNILLLSIKENTNNTLKKYHELDKNLQTKLKIFKKFSKVIIFIVSTILAPLISFFKKNGVLIALSILSFIFLFKIGEAFLGRMSVLFYKEIGFSKSDIGIFSKALGWITTIIFTLIGGFLTIKTGVFKSLFVAGIFMAFTNLLFALLAWTGKSYLIFSIAVILDDIAAAFATVAFVAFISLLVDRNYTATQYALLASIGTAGRTTLASSSGSLVDWLNGDWSTFFIITTIMVIPSLIILFFIRKKIVF